MAPSIPTPEEVNSYLAAHSLESTIEDAVNDAVLKQVKNPYRHIAEILLKKSDEMGEVSNMAPRRASQESGAKRATIGGVQSLATNTHATSGDAELHREYQTTENVELPAALEAKLKEFFDKMDLDKDGNVTKEEAIKHWGKNFAKVNAQSMFNEVDEDGNEQVSWLEFRKFWENVIGSGYPPDDVMEEVDMMLEGGSWVDFNDGRTT